MLGVPGPLGAPQRDGTDAGSQLGFPWCSEASNREGGASQPGSRGVLIRTWEIRV